MLRNAGEPTRPAAPFTHREIDIRRLLACGMTLNQAARRAPVLAPTVETYMRTAYRRVRRHKQVHALARRPISAPYRS